MVLWLDSFEVKTMADPDEDLWRDMMSSKLSHPLINSGEQHQQLLHFSAFSFSYVASLAHLQSHGKQLHVSLHHYVLSLQGHCTCLMGKCRDPKVEAHLEAATYLLDLC